jgi:acyl carrier protein
MEEKKATDLPVRISTEEIKKIISRISRIPVDELDDDARIREDLGVDSILAMEIIATFELKLGFTFDVDKYSCVDEVGEFVNIVKELGSSADV